jgi:hypothetical protein
MAPGIVEADHRSGVRAADIVGTAAVVANQRALYELLGLRQIEFLAVRGDRLLLAHLRWGSSEQFELGCLMVLETDAEGRLCRTDAYDEDDLLTSMDAMDSRHRELAGESLSAFERLDAHGPLNRRDWTAFEATMSPDFVAIDHSPLNFAHSDRAGFINQMRTLTDRVPDAVFMRTKIYSSGAVGLFRGRVLGSTIEGNAYEWAHVLVVRLDDDGRAVRHEVFPDDQWTEALALFDEWVASTT